MLANESVTAVSRRSGPLAGLAVVGTAVVAAVVVWLVATQAFGMDLRAPSFDASQPSQAVGIGSVIVVSLLAALLGWGLYALLERFTPARARLIWTVVAVAFLLLSLGGPMSGTGTTGSSRAVLALLHLVVGATVIVGLPRVASRRI
jgi:hypothetical protein